jgi:hypothetical protein
MLLLYSTWNNIFDKIKINQNVCDVLVRIPAKNLHVQVENRPGVNLIKLLGA